MYNGELTLTNHGLVRAEEMNYTFPESDKYYDYESLAPLPEILEAKQQIIVPYRITCLAKLGEESTESSGGSGGGGGYNYQKPICFDYCYTPCPNEPESTVCDTICSLISKIKVDKGSTVGGQAAEPISVIIAGNAKGGGHKNVVVGEGPKAQELFDSDGTSSCETTTYTYRTEKNSIIGSYNPDHPDEDQKDNKNNSDEAGQNDCTNSHVNLVFRDYSFAVTDLSMMLNGFNIEVTRIYNSEKGKWINLHNIDRIEGKFRYTTNEGIPSHGDSPYNYLLKGDIEYTCVSWSSDPLGFSGIGPFYIDFLYAHKGGYTISTIGGRWVDMNANIEQPAKYRYKWDGYLWKSPTGDWKEYDEWGRKVAYGDRNNNRIELIYAGNEFAKTLIGVKDATGRQVIWYSYNTNNSISAVYDHIGRSVHYTYNDNGQLKMVKDVLGNKWEYEYDTDDTTCKLVTKTDPLERSIKIGYNKKGEVKSVIDSEENETFYEYNYDKVRAEYYASINKSDGMLIERYFNKDGNLIKELINEKLNRKITYVKRTESSQSKPGSGSYYVLIISYIYDTGVRIINTPAGTTIKKFDEWGNLICIQNPDGTSHSYQYDRYSDLLEETNEKGVITRYKYNNCGNRIQMIEAADTDHERITRYTYDEQGKGNLEYIALLDGSEIKMEYDDYGHMIKVTDAENNITEYTYDDIGNITSKKDADGNMWQYEYDKKNHLISETDPLYYETRYEYDAVGDLRVIIDAYNNRTEYTYDSHHKIKEIKDALGGIIHYEYNADGNLIENIDQMNNNTRYEYDDVQRRDKLIDPAGNVIKYDYEDEVGAGCEDCASGDAVDKPSTIIYPTYTMNLEYDPMGRVVKETKVLDENTSYETHYSYDAVGNLIEKTDPEGNTTIYEYDVLDRLIKVTDAENGITRYGYDIRDNLISITDAEGNMTTFTYDRNGNKIGSRRHLGQETNYSYDARGNLSSIIDAKNQKAVYNYDAANRIKSIEYYSSSGNPMPDKTVNFDYDEVGNLISFNDEITSTTYTYDELSRKVGETVNYGDFTLSYSYTYNADGTKKSFTGSDDVTSDFIYTDGQLNAIHIPQVGDISFKDHRWLSPTRVHLPGGTVMNLDYDPLQRIKKIQSQDASNDIFIDYIYSRDTVGNVVSKATEHGNYTYFYDKTYQLLSTDNPMNPTINDEAYTYDKVGNRLTASSHQGEWNYNENNQLTSCNGVSFTYDNNGNLIQKVVDGQTTNYIYNIEDRLIQIKDENGSIIAKYYYDPFGRRLWKEVDGIKTYFFYSEEGLIGEYDASGNEIKSYGYVPNSMWTTNPLFQKIGGTYYFYQNDYLGTPQKIIDASGDVVWSAVYDSFEKCEIIVEERSNNLRFPGQYYDEETGLSYNWYRYYDSMIGRYISADPIGFNSGDKNFYRYVNNNPVNLIDTMGLTICLDEPSPFPMLDPGPSSFPGQYTALPPYVPIGLTKWKGNITVTSGGEIFGGGVLVGAFKSDVHNGKQSTVIVAGVMGGVTAGSPISVTTTHDITLITPGAPDPTQFFGAISFLSANIGIGIDLGLSYLEIGEAKSENVFSFQYGIDASTSGYVGWAIALPKNNPGFKH
ncbi:MAG: RHS repeat-associated core domain-containing protein [bacterium]